MNTPDSVSNSRALAAFSMGALFFALAFVQRVAPSVMTTELMRDFAVGGAALGTLSGWYFYAYASIQIPVGMLNDRFGPRKLMSVAVAVCALGSFGFALSESVLAASFFRAVIGASVAFAFVGTLTIAGYWFAPARFAMLAGMVQTVGMCGAMLGQAPLRYAVEQFGWRAAVGVMGVAAAVMALLLFYIVPRRPRSGESNTPEQSAPPSTFAGVVAVVANPQSWACAGIGFGMTAIMLSFAGLWAVPWLSSVYDYPVSRAAWVVSMLFFGWALGAPVMGWLSDHTGKRRPVIAHRNYLQHADFFGGAVRRLQRAAGHGDFVFQPRRERLDDDRGVRLHARGQLAAPQRHSHGAGQHVRGRLRRGDATGNRLAAGPRLGRTNRRRRAHLRRRRLHRRVQRFDRLQSPRAGMHPAAARNLL